MKNKIISSLSFPLITNNYKNERHGFSFQLPLNWRYEPSNSTLTFFGPNGYIGCSSEFIQIKVAPISPEYITPESREKFLAEPGASVFRTKLGNENNVVVLQRKNNTEISAVNNGMCYILLYFNDPESLKAIELIKSTFVFPVPLQISSAVTSSEINNLNKALINAVRLQNFIEAKRLMLVLKNALEIFIRSNRTDVGIKHLVDALADSAGAYDATEFEEAKLLRDFAIESLKGFGKEAVPFIKLGLSHSDPAVKRIMKELYEFCNGKPWWKII